MAHVLDASDPVADAALAENARLRSQLRFVEEQAAANGRRVKELEEALAEVMADRDALRADVAALTAEVRALRAELAGRPPRRPDSTNSSAPPSADPPMTQPSVGPGAGPRPGAGPPCWRPSRRPSPPRVPSRATPGRPCLGASPGTSGSSSWTAS